MAARMAKNATKATTIAKAEIPIKENKSVLKPNPSVPAERYFLPLP
jgi:hypothetical protein